MKFPSPSDEMIKIKILHHYDISPPANSVPVTTLPLTFFDIPFLQSGPAQCLFFYDFPQSPPSFAHTAVPLLIHSLSLCLRHFFPFAASLVLPLAPPLKPHILYSDGDSLPSTIAESVAYFAELVSDEAHKATLIHPLLPQLRPPQVSNSARMEPLTAIQVQCIEGGATDVKLREWMSRVDMTKGNAPFDPVRVLERLATCPYHRFIASSSGGECVTLFPNKGICIGVQFLHVVADGRSFNHFMQSRASIHRFGEDPTCVDPDASSPFHDRQVIKDLNGLESTLLKDWWSCGGPSPSPYPSEALLAVGDKVRATFARGEAHIDGLKAQVLSELENGDIDSELEQIHLSTFVVTCAFIWVSMIKSQEKEPDHCDQSSSESAKEKLCYFCFLADCRDRLKYSIPSTYFGNCLDIHYLSEKRNALLSKNGISHAVRAIGRRVKEWKTGGGLRGAEGWIRDRKVIDNTDLVIVAGSPRLKVYDTDFGWGRPTKSHVVHIDLFSAISLAESRNGDGGVEVSLALTRACMEKFISLFEKGLKSFMSL